MRLAAIIAATGLVGVLAGCGGKSSNALYSFSHPWGVGQSAVPAGKVWAAGSIPLCTQGQTPVTLTSITPAVKSGQIRVDRIIVRQSHPGHTVGDYPGFVAGRPVAGFVIAAPSPCKWPSQSDPFYETIVMAHLTGPRGGYIKGLRVDYRTGSKKGTYTIPFSFEFCGARGGPRHCRN